ncbi:hypothetical protein CJF30_00004539 [Rutstroemia sp. NJR-2017a BBW]|nr:hypothetical protein CJF30_00004539 [Rutstroemia sp. NJR-2017a BBW]
MRYFPESAIKYPPHNPAIDLDVAKELDLEPQTIELLQALPVEIQDLLLRPARISMLKVGHM